MKTNFGTTVSFLRLQKGARQGMGVAMLMLGYYYQEGWSTKQDYLKASRWYLNAIKKGEPMAMLFLGQLYQFGHGVKQDGKKAVLLFKKAYRRGITASPIHLARIYDYGMNNIRPNRKLAIYWYKIAVRHQGHGDNLAGIRLAELLKPHTK